MVDRWISSYPASSHSFLCRRGAQGLSPSYAKAAADKPELEAAGRQQPPCLPVVGKGTEHVVQPRSPSPPARASYPPILLRPTVLHTCPEMLREGPGNIPRPRVPGPNGPGLRNSTPQQLGKMGESKRVASECFPFKGSPTSTARPECIALVVRVMYTGSTAVQHPWPSNLSPFSWEVRGPHYIFTLSNFT